MTKRLIKIILRDFLGIFLIFFYIKFNNYQIILLRNDSNDFFLYSIIFFLTITNFYWYFIEIINKLNNQSLFFLFLIRNYIFFMFFFLVFYHIKTNTPFYINNPYFRVIPVEYSLFFFKLIVLNSYENSSLFLNYLEMFTLKSLETPFLNLNQALNYFNLSFSTHLSSLLDAKSKSVINLMLGKLSTISALEKDNL